MFAWSLSLLLLFVGLKRLLGEFVLAGGGFGIGHQKARLTRVIKLLQELEETLATGLVPAQERWDALNGLPPPWGILSFESIRELRSSGGTLVPTLKRIRALAEEHQNSLGQARAKASQAMSQALVCTLLVPIFGSLLYVLLPGVQTHPIGWGGACLVALATASLGALWLLKMSEAARWGGLRSQFRPWVLAAQCGGERFLALVRSGSPPDLAWSRTCELLRSEVPQLASHWGAAVWSEGVTFRGRGEGERILIETGTAIRKSVQISVMEGRPCAERVEGALLSLRQDFQAQVERELSLLGIRALKPLFTCVAPALLGLLGAGLWLSWAEAFATPGGWGGGL